MKTMFLAKPNLINFSGSKKFKTLREAKLFLESVTEYKMSLEDWICIGKILKTDSVGNVSEFTETEIKKLK